MDNYIFTSYFTGKLDPQRKKQWKTDDASKFEKWYKSIDTLNLNAIIFHDSLSKEFVEKNKKHNLKFVRCNNDYAWSTNDFRFAIYNHYLKSHPEIKKVFMTDMTDVVVKQNPFEWIKEGLVYAGLDCVPGVISKSWWARTKKYGLVYEYVDFWKKLNKHPVLNAGIIGGYREDMLFFLEKMVEEFESVNRPEENNNMAVFNYVLYKYFPNKIVTGEPVCSKFGKKEHKRKDVWFIHK